MTAKRLGAERSEVAGRLVTVGAFLPWILVAAPAFAAPVVSVDEVEILGAGDGGAAIEGQLRAAVDAKHTQLEACGDVAGDAGAVHKVSVAFDASGKVTKLDRLSTGLTDAVAACADGVLGGL